MAPSVGNRVDQAGLDANPRRRLRVLVSSGIFPNRILVNRGIYNLKAASALRHYCDVRVVAPVPYFPSFARLPKYEWCARVPRRDTIAGFGPRWGLQRQSLGVAFHSFQDLTLEFEAAVDGGIEIGR